MSDWTAGQALEDLAQAFDKRAESCRELAFTRSASEQTRLKAKAQGFEIAANLCRTHPAFSQDTDRFDAAMEAAKGER